MHNPVLLQQQRENLNKQGHFSIFEAMSHPLTDEGQNLYRVYANLLSSSQISLNTFHISIVNKYNQFQK